MPDLKGTKTAVNLLAAFSGKAQAGNRYAYYADMARKKGCEQIAGIFSEAAENEKERAKSLFRLLRDVVPFGPECSPEAEWENRGRAEMYARFAEEAREEGFDRIARLFEEVGGIGREQ